jgi:DNA-binding PadR family transcriptional regulator
MTIKDVNQGLIVKLHKNLNMQGYDIKQKIENYFFGSNETLPPVHQEERLNRSCPPPQQTSA